MIKFDNSFKLNESIIKSLNKIIKYQNYLLLKMIKENAN